VTSDPALAPDAGHSSAHAEELSGQLAADEVHGVALCYVDTAGVARVKGIPVAGLVSAAQRGVGMSPVFDTFLADEVHGVALCYVDTAGVARVKGIPVAGLVSAAQRGVGMSPVFDTFLAD